MGYANMPVAIGWILESIGAGAWYDANGDKKNFYISIVGVNSIAGMLVYAGVIWMIERRAAAG